MKNELFEIIINNLDTKLSQCHEYLDHIHTTKDLEMLSISEAKNLRDFAAAEVKDQTKIAMGEIYHIIGMGNLSAIQTQIFIKKVKEYLSFRPTLKTLAVDLIAIDDLPKIPIHAKYRLSVLGTFEVTSGEDAVEIDADETNIEFIRKVKNLDCPFELRGREIRVFDLKQFLEVVSTCGIAGGDLSVLQKRIALGGNYLGIKWETRVEISDKSYFVGQVTASPIFKKLKNFYNIKNVE